MDVDLYFSANLGSMTNVENLLLDTFFEPDEYTKMQNVSFDQWKQVKLSENNNNSSNDQTNQNNTSTSNSLNDQNISNNNSNQQTPQQRILEHKLSQQQTQNNLPNDPNNPIDTDQAQQQTPTQDQGNERPQQENNPNDPDTSSTQEEEVIEANLIEIDSISVISSLKKTKGFKKEQITSTGTINWAGQRSGVVLSPNSSLEIAPTPLYFRFKPEKSNPSFQDSSLYTDTSSSPNFSWDTDIQGDSTFARIHSPTFYFKFLLQKDSQFPLLFFTRGDIRRSNSIAVMFHHDAKITSGASLNSNTNSQFFRTIVFFTDNTNKMFTFETDFIFETGKVHSLGLTFFQFFGEFAQVVVTFDDGKYFKASSIIKGAIFNNNLDAVRFFPKDQGIFKTLQDKILNSNSSNNNNTNESDQGESSPSDVQVNSPGLGSVLFRFSLMNSGSAFLSNILFGNNFSFIENCLSTCAINYAFKTQPYVEDQNLTFGLDGSLIKKGYVSDTCFSCTSLNKPLNSSVDFQSIYPVRPNSNLTLSQSLTSTYVIPLT
jgi:hypothetical protein